MGAGDPQPQGARDELLEGHLGAAHHELEAVLGPDLGDLDLTATEGTWNLGVGFVAVVAPDKADAAASALTQEGIATWQVGVVRTGGRPDGDWTHGAKGVDGGAVRLVGAFAETTS